MTPKWLLSPTLLSSLAGLFASSALAQTVYPMQPLHEPQPQYIEEAPQPINERYAEPAYPPPAVLASLPRPDVDIDELSARIQRAGADWRLDVDYQVDIDHAGRSAEPLQLVLSVRDDEGVLADPEGRPFEVMIPLDRPSDVDDDEFEFEAGTALSLPDGAFAWPHRLVLEGIVLDPRDSAVLDRDSTRVRYSEPVYYQPAPVVVESPVVVDSYPSSVYVADPYPVYVDPYPRSVVVGAHLSFGRSHCVSPAREYHRRTVVVRRPDHRVVVRSPNVIHHSPRVVSRHGSVVHRSNSAVVRRGTTVHRPQSTVHRTTVRRTNGIQPPPSRPHPSRRP